MAELPQFSPAGTEVGIHSLQNGSDHTVVGRSNVFHAPESPRSSIAASSKHDAHAVGGDPPTTGHALEGRPTILPHNSPVEDGPEVLHHQAHEDADNDGSGDVNLTTTSARKVYDCHICGWRFALKGNLVAHLRRHTGEKPYICNICNRKFTQSSLLTVHLRTHTGEKPFKCTKCGRSFSRSGNLTTHMRTHNDTKPFECGFCHKTFSQRVNMQLHTRVHTGVKPYRCGVCNRAFTSCSNMRRHWRHLHPSYPEPAVGTLHLLHGMPEKSLYSDGTARVTEYSGPQDQFHDVHNTSETVPVSTREDAPSLLRSNNSEPLYAHMLGHGINSLANPIPHHQVDTQMNARMRHSIGTGMNDNLSTLNSPINPQIGSHLSPHLAAQMSAHLQNGVHSNAHGHGHGHAHDANGHIGTPHHHANHHANHHHLGQSLIVSPAANQHHGTQRITEQFSLDSNLNHQQFNTGPPRIHRTDEAVDVLPLETHDDFDPAIKDDDRRVVNSVANEH